VVALVDEAIVARGRGFVGVGHPAHDHTLQVSWPNLQECPS